MRINSCSSLISFQDKIILFGSIKRKNISNFHFFFPFFSFVDCRSDLPKHSILHYQARDLFFIKSTLSLTNARFFKKDN